jgi:hypothetical protein
MSEDMIQISLEEYEGLQEAAKQLAHLEALGVDNWEGYSYYAEDEDEEEDD